MAKDQETSRQYAVHSGRVRGRWDMFAVWVWQQLQIQERNEARGRPDVPVAGYKCYERHFASEMWGCRVKSWTWAIPRYVTINYSKLS